MITERAPNGRLLKSRDAAEFLGLELVTLRSLVRAKKIPHFNYGRLGFYERDLREWMDRQRAGGVPVSASRTQRLVPTRSETATGISDLLPRVRRFSKVATKTA